MRVGDTYAPHGCPDCDEAPHGRVVIQGARGVFINGRPAARMGDAIDCGGEAAGGSPNVFIGDAGGDHATPCQEMATDTGSTMIKTGG